MIYNKIRKAARLFVPVCLSAFTLFTACTDEIKFGNAFLEKAPGGSVTQDTVFGKAEYTRQFLASIYSRQYYGLTVGTDDGYATSLSGWCGKIDALSDCFQLYYTSAKPYNYYYSGTLTANDENMFDFCGEYVWEVVRWCYLMLENIDRVPDMSEAEKNRIKAEIQCLIAVRYFDLFQYYGGLPIVRSSFAASASSYEMPRATAEETVKFMVEELLDEAIKNEDLPWAYTGAEAATETGHWTKAGAMALKCRILAFAASPLFNSDKGYYGGTSQAEQQHLVWYGGYKPEYWTRLKTACQEFFTALNANGHYTLSQAEGTRPEDYRLAFRKAYFVQDSPEVLHSVRVTTNRVTGTDYNWYYWIRLGRNSYCPTQEYVEMFPWSDGTPFDWEKTEAEGNLDKMFLVGDTAANKRGKLINVRLTRDPRLYESCIVNGMQKSLDWTTGNMGGDIYENWVGGTDAGNNSLNETGNFATGYFLMKYALGTSDKTTANPDISGHNFQWTTIRLAEIYLLYAEALIQADNNLPEAIRQIDIIRNRVGLKGLVECNPDKNLTTDKEALLAELLRERACEFGFENLRYQDIVRYKLGSVLEQPLHGLLIHRLKLENGEWVEDNTKWTGSNERRYPQPTHFKYEKFVINNRARVWWDGFDPKWYLQPIRQTEINKNYGLIQNPGW